MIINKATITFVEEHRNDDVRTLALQARRDDGIDMPWALNQIQGWQTAQRKLPSWAAIDNIIYPPHLSMEQCSSEQTALYKCGIVDRLPEGSHETLIDLTGGFGVDFSFMAKHCNQAIYVERDENLCETARHNFELLGLEHTTIIHGEAESVLKEITTNPATTLIYLDPARRDSNKARTYAIADCSPNVLDLLDLIFKTGHQILLKLSPMFDWHKAVSDLGKRVAEVHIVSVANECKELLLLMRADHDGEPKIHCVNDGQVLIYAPSEDESHLEIATDVDAAYLYEPNASIMKAGCFRLLTQHYSIKAMATDSHLYVSSEKVMDFPGRCFAIAAVTSMNKKELGQALKGITRANVAVRNFPLTAQQLRNRLHLQDGGECYIFGTKTADGRHILYICKKL